MELFKEYLGDGAYVHHDGYQTWLTTSDGIRTTNAVALDDSALAAFLSWVERLKSRNFDTALAALDKAGEEGEP